MTLFHDSTSSPSVPAPRRLRIPRPRPAAALLLAAVLFLPACSGNRNPGRSSDQLRFGVDMARRGLWSEALFRFQEAQRLDPQSPRILNNLAVASEALGQFDTALEYYRRALQLDPNSREARANYSRFAEFYQSFKGPQRGAARPGAPAPAAAPPGRAAVPAAPGEPGEPGEPAAEPADAPVETPAEAPGSPLPVTPPGQAPIQPPTPPTGNVATPPDPANEPPPSPPPPASPAAGGSQAYR